MNGVRETEQRNGEKNNTTERKKQQLKKKKTEESHQILLLWLRKKKRACSQKNLIRRLRFVFQPSSFDVRANGDQMWKKKEEESLWDYEKTWKKGTFKVKIFTKKIHFFLRKHPILLSFSLVFITLLSSR